MSGFQRFRSLASEGLGFLRFKVLYRLIPIVSIVVPFLVEPIIYQGSYKVTPKRSYSGDYR